MWWSSRTLGSAIEGSAASRSAFFGSPGTRPTGAPPPQGAALERRAARPPADQLCAQEIARESRTGTFGHSFAEALDILLEATEDEETAVLGPGRQLGRQGRRRRRGGAGG